MVLRYLKKIKITVVNCPRACPRQYWNSHLKTNCRYFWVTMRLSITSVSGELPPGPGTQRKLHVGLIATSQAIFSHESIGENPFSSCRGRYQPQETEVVWEVVRPRGLEAGSQGAKAVLSPRLQSSPTWGLFPLQSLWRRALFFQESSREWRPGPSRVWTQLFMPYELHSTL